MDVSLLARRRLGFSPPRVGLACEVLLLRFLALGHIDWFTFVGELLMLILNKLQFLDG